MRTALTVLALLVFTATRAEAEGWPRSIESGGYTITIYQPQVEEFDGTRLEARAAVAVRDDEDDEPVIGAVWLSLRVDTDRDTRMVYVQDTEVPNVRFPDASEERRDQLADLLESRIPEWDLSFSLDRLIAELDRGGKGADTPGLKHDPPQIILATEPTILVSLDGDPIEQPLKDTDLIQVVNTPFMMVKDGAGTYYLSGGGDLWYGATASLGPWEVAASVPQSVRRLETESEPDAEAGDEPPPKIIVATAPTELIVSAGKPSWSPVSGLDLLYMDNTDSHVLMDIVEQFYYVQLSGRWYRGTAIEGTLTWEHVANDQLPDVFDEVPADGAMGDILPHVAGTTQAREAVLDNSIPQTSAIKRDNASLEVEYDGDPQFEPVEGLAEVLYAINTPNSVFKYENRFYACEQAVWYASGSATGPWEVATEIPVALYDLPPSNPHYNVTYVKVYDVTPEVVYVGYTPGYVGSYPYGGCVVWGTGWWYRPWYGHWYYPRPRTWGFHVHYSPWTGWGFGVSFGSGPFRFTFGVGGYGRRAWFGPVGFRPYRRPYVHGGYRRTNINVNVGDVNIGGAGNRPANRPETRPADRSNNLYDRPENRQRNDPQPTTADRRPPDRAGNGANDVLTDRSGNVYRKDDKGAWQTRDGGQWKPAGDLDRPAGAQTGGAATRPQLERDQRARDRGTQRTQQYQRSGGGSRGGAGRGGGRRR